MPERPRASLRHQLANNLVWYAVSMGANFAARFVSLALLWRALGGSATGQRHYAWLSAATALVMILADAGLENATIRFFAEGNEYYRALMRLLRRASLTIALPAIAVLSAGWYLYAANLDGFFAGVAGWGFALFQVAAALYRSRTQVNRYAYWNCGRNILITLAVWIAHTRGALALGTWFLLYGSISLSAAVAMVRSARPSSPPHDDAPAHLHRVRAYALPLYACAIILWGQGFIDKGFLTLYHPRDLPPFQLLLDYSLFFGTIALLVNRAWPAIFFSLARSGSRAATDMGRHLLMVHAGAGIAALAVLLAAPRGTAVLSGTPFATPTRMTALACMLFAESVGIFLAVVRPNYEYHRRTVFLLWTCSAAVLVNGAGNALLVPPLGLTGAAGATTVSIMLLFWVLFAGQKGIAHKRRVGLTCAALQAITFALLLLLAPHLTA